MQETTAAPKRAAEDRPRYLKLQAYEEVLRIIVASLCDRQVPTERVSAAKMFRRICAGTIRSRTEIPGLHTASMDGYAVKSSDTAAASPLTPVRLQVTKTTAPSRNKRGGAIRGMESQCVSTGEKLPEGADAVVRLERVRRLNDSFVELTHPVAPWKDVL